MPVDLKDIRTYRGSQNEAFEELVCQLVRRTDAAGNKTWMRLDGAGGDGGVEAYWSPATGEETGLQAKFFVKSGEVGWNQITSSFKTALRIHPQLTEYRVYLACDLTGPTGKAGLSGVDKWNATRKRMEAHGSKAGRSVSIILKTASDVLSELARREAAGLQEFWFGAIEVTPARLGSWLDSAVSALGERYHPEDHVDVSAQDVLRSLSRAEGIRARLLGLVGDVLECDRLEVPRDWGSEPSKAKAIGRVNILIDALARIKKDVEVDAAQTWPVGEWLQGAEAAETGLEALSSDAMSSRSNNEEKESGLPYFRYKCREMLSALRPVLELLSSAALKAEASRAAIFVGPAGCGKSHLLAAAAEEILGDGGVCVMLLGHRFQTDQLWPQVAAVLGAPGKNKEEILGAVDAAAAASRRRGLIIIDALNEGPLRSTWLKELEGFANDVLAYPNLALAVSCRDVFVEHVISPKVAARFPVVQLQGFETDEEQEAAAQVFLDRRGIARPSVPWLAPEFVNPLFLRSCANALKSAGIKAFPTGLHGTKQLLEFYVDALARTLGTEWDGSIKLAGPCKTALVGIAKAMADRRLDWLERQAADVLINTAFASFKAPDGMSWLDVLLRNGVLREDPHPEGHSSDPLVQKPDVIRYAFQRFQDHLMAEALLADVKDAVAAFAAGGQLSFMLYSNGLPSWEWSGLVEALSIQLPEKLGTELVDALPGGAQRHWGDYSLEGAFVQSIKWRDPKAVSARSLELANQLRSGASILKLLIELAARTDHPWNADLLDRNLRGWSLPERDERWTVYISTEGMYAGHAIDRVTTWCESASKENADDEVLRLCAIAVCWFQTSSALLVRDRATKALASLFTDRPALFDKILRQFSDVDDLYVVERALAAGYGSLLRWPTQEKARLYSLAVWECFFGKGYVPPHLLLADYALGIIECAENLNALPESVDLAKCRPPYQLPYALHSRSAPPLVIADVDAETLGCPAIAIGPLGYPIARGKRRERLDFRIRPSRLHTSGWMVLGEPIALVAASFIF